MTNLNFTLEQIDETKQNLREINVSEYLNLETDEEQTEYALEFLQQGGF